MKVIAFYLPQFHAIPENDEWWGKGFTEWVNVKKAKPLFDGHYQPRVPLNKNYYNLLNDDVMDWQVKLAKEYGVYGFCFYHYWFNGHMLLEKPVENFLNNKKLDLPFCICWANEHWTNAWVSKENKILIAQRYGGPKEWKEHFEYILNFIKDPRYIMDDGRPLIVIYRPELIECLNDMLDYWQELSIKAGLDGLSFAYEHPNFDFMPHKDDSRFKYNIEYQPSYANYDLNKNRQTFLRVVKTKIIRMLDKFEISIIQPHRSKLIKSSYDEVWGAVLRHTPENEKCIPGAFVDWDNTPRRQNRGSVFIGATPEKFEKYMTEQIKRAKEIYHKDMIFLFAWNEWAEGGYMEPDEKYGYGYLEALRNALIATSEYKIFTP